MCRAVFILHFNVKKFTYSRLSDFVKSLFTILLSRTQIRTRRANLGHNKETVWPEPAYPCDLEIWPYCVCQTSMSDRYSLSKSVRLQCLSDFNVFQTSMSVRPQCLSDFHDCQTSMSFRLPCLLDFNVCQTSNYSITLKWLHCSFSSSIWIKIILWWPSCSLSVSIRTFAQVYDTTNFICE